MKKILALLVLAPMAVVADHRPEFQSLIDEPANMLDIAMLRLDDYIFWTKPYMAFEYHIAAETDNQRHIDINAQYREDEGVIHVSASLSDKQSTREQMEAGCHRVLTMMRVNIGKGLGGFFSRVDGSFRPTAGDQPAKLSELIELSCRVYGHGSNDRRFGATMSLNFSAEMVILTAN